MDYELAKALKDAGFPQGGRGRWVGPSDKLIWRSGDRCYIPTLEELIAACGQDFRELMNAETGWIARAYRAHGEGAGNTPAEAVARLWLARAAS